MERILRKSVGLIYFTVVTALVSAVILYLAATLLLGNIIFNAVTGDIWGWEAARMVAVSLLKVWDLLLIAASFQIMSTGMYRLFINPAARLPGPFLIESFDDLKSVLVSLAMVILVILFLESAIKLGPGRDLLEFGLAIAAVILAIGWTMRRN